MDGVLEQAAEAATSWSHSSAPAPAPLPRIGLPETSSETTILVVDDSPTNLAAMAALLAPHYRVRTTTSGMRALRIAHTQPAPDLILLDVMMPRLSGPDVLARLRADPATRQIPVIFITAGGDSDAEGESLDLEAADYITRPFRPAAVLSRIRVQLQQTRAQAALAERNAALAAEVTRGAIDAEHLQDVTILALARLAQARDRETGNHLKRTAEYVRVLAMQLSSQGLHASELTPAVITALAKSAPLHDIGKVAIPDHILLKPGTLTAAEWEIMKTHTSEGRYAIERAERDAGIQVGFLSFAKEICQSHHERWDGSGYPGGLIGTAIPLSARLMAVADVFDALISKRPYKQPMSTLEARQLIVAGRGCHFDPDVVDAFLECFGQFEAIAERFADADRR